MKLTIEVEYKNQEMETKEVEIKEKNLEETIVDTEENIEEIEELQFDSDFRKYLLWYMTAGGSKNHIGTFKGKVSQIRSDYGFLLTNVSVSFLDENEEDKVVGKEQHVWIKEIDSLKNANVKVGDHVEFKALVYLYKRKDHTFDFALKNLKDVRTIPNHSIPTKEVLILQSAEKIVCENCKHIDHCYGLCLIGTNYKRDAVVEILKNNKVSKEFINSYFKSNPF